MKVKCEHCNKDISNTVFRTITKNEVGTIKCNHCNKENKRYLSELDLMYILTLNFFVYGLAILIFMLVVNNETIISNDNFFIIYAVSVVLSLGICFVFTRQNDLYHYINPPFKKTWSNTKQKEDSEEVTKRINYNTIMFIIIAIVIGTNPDWLYLYIFMYIAFIIITGIKVYLLYKNEDSKYSNKKGS